MSAMAKYIATLFFVVIMFQTVSLEKFSRTRRSPGLLDRVSNSRSTTPSSVPSLIPSSLLDFSKIQEELKRMGNLSQGLEKALEMEKTARLGLQTFIESVKNRIETLENAVYPDESSYWEESTSCGGVMISQTGRISYKLDSHYEHHEKCVWTIRTNYRSKVKVQLLSHGLESGFDFVAVTEVKENVEPRSVKLTQKGKYVFDGPILLVTFLTDGSGGGSGFSLEFEGVGQNIKKDVVYKHFYFNSTFGTFSAENLTDSNSNLPTRALHEFTTVVFSPPIQNATQLSITVDENVLNLQTDTCEKASLVFYDYLEQNNTRIRCCTTKCEEDVSTLTDHGSVVLAAITSQLSRPDPESTFQFTWDAKEDIRRSDSIDICGGTVSGREGRISYKHDQNYENNERCVWAIKPTGKSQVKVALQSSALEDGYDFISVSSFDQNSDMLQTKITRHGIYNFTGPVILVTFYSDDSSIGKGFELDWVEYGNPLIDANDPVYEDEDSGSVSLSLKSQAYQIVIINPKYLDGSSVNLKLNSFESQPQQIKNEETECGSLGLSVYGNDEQKFSLAKRFCDVQGEEIIPEEFSAVGGLFILFVKMGNPDNDTKLELTWRKGSPPNRNFDGLKYANNTDECGGVLIGDAGEIAYKLHSQYENNARCTWVVESNKLSKMSFKLIKDGFESCCDNLIATPFNVESGTLDEGVAINRENRVQSFSTPLVFITFYSDGSVGPQGFRLDFSTSGNEMGVGRIGFTHNILHETNGSVSYSHMEENLLESNGTMKIVTNVLNIKKLDLEIVPIIIDVQTNDFAVDADNECHRDSLSFFPIRDLKHGSGAGTQFVAGCSESCNCSTAPQSTVMEMQGGFFISIFKPLESNKKASFSFNWTPGQAST